MYILLMNLCIHLDSIEVTDLSFGSGDSSIYLNGIHCDGGEERLIDCPRNLGNLATCDHSQDVGVRCQGAYYHLLNACTNDLPK